MILVETLLIVIGLLLGWVIIGPATPTLTIGDRLIVLSDIVEIVAIDRQDRRGAILTVRVVGYRRYPWDAQVHWDLDTLVARAVYAAGT